MGGNLPAALEDCRQFCHRSGDAITPVCDSTPLGSSQRSVKVPVLICQAIPEKGPRNLYTLAPHPQPHGAMALPSIPKTAPPLGLPPGSVRAILALLLSGSLW